MVYVRGKIGDSGINCKGGHLQQRIGLSLQPAILSRKQLDPNKRAFWKGNSLVQNDGTSLDLSSIRHRVTPGDILHLSAGIAYSSPNPTTFVNPRGSTPPRWARLPMKGSHSAAFMLRWRLPA